MTASKIPKNRGKRPTNRRCVKAASLTAKPPVRVSVGGQKKGQAKSSARPIKRTLKTEALSEKGWAFIEGAEEIFSTYKHAVLREKNLRALQKLQGRYIEEKIKPYDRALNKLRRQLYHYLRSKINSPGGHILIKNIYRKFEIDPKGASYSENPFYVGLVSIDNDTVLTVAQTGLLARQMLYANRHDVPPCLLVGFLTQSGITAEISDEQAKTAKEPWESDEKFVTYAADQKD